MSQFDKTRIEPVWLSIEGMSCGSCAANVERALRAVPGAEQAEVDLSNGRARIHGNAAPDRLITAVERAGYGARQTNAPVSEEEGHGRRGCC